MKTETKSVNARIPKDMWQFLRKYGYDRETNISGAFRLIVKEKMEEKNATPAK